jgi:hypothetical protein
MKESHISKIVGIAQDLKHFENSLEKINGMNDPMCELMRFQFQHSKEKLLKELLVELVNSGIDFKEIQDFMTSLTNYLSQKDGKGENFLQLLV